MTDHLVTDQFVTGTAIQAGLAVAVAEVLERMFFLDSLVEVKESPRGPDIVVVQLAFDGDPPGCFEMRLARTAALAVAADFLGEDPDAITPQQSIEVTLELANMICGAVLSRIESSATFRLGTPEVAGAECGEAGPSEAHRYAVETGSGTLSVAIQMKVASCLATERYAS